MNWFSRKEAVALLDAAQGPENPLIHLELRLMMRRLEVRRLTMQETMVGAMDVHGKGRYGDMWHTLAWAPETLGMLLQWKEIRERLITKARVENPKA